MVAGRGHGLGFAANGAEELGQQLARVVDEGRAGRERFRDRGLRFGVSLEVAAAESQAAIEIDAHQVLELLALNQRPVLEFGSPAEVHAIPRRGPGPQVVRANSVLEAEEHGDAAVVFIGAPRRPPGVAHQRLDLSVVAVAEQVEVVDALLQQHRMGHRHHVVAQVVAVAVALPVVGEVPVAEGAQFTTSRVVTDPL